MTHWPSQRRRSGSRWAAGPQSLWRSRTPHCCTSASPGIAELIALSRATLANVKQNVAIAVGLKLIFLATTLLGLTGLWMAILADTGATVLVTVAAGAAGGVAGDLVEQDHAGRDTAEAAPGCSPLPSKLTRR